MWVLMCWEGGEKGVGWGFFVGLDRLGWECDDLGICYDILCFCWDSV